MIHDIASNETLMNFTNREVRNGTSGGKDVSIEHNNANAKWISVRTDEYYNHEESLQD
jgi:hypothetical protein